MNQDAIFDWYINKQIFNRILSKPQNYPGKHLQSQPRTNPSYKPLEPKAQYHIINKATSEYIREQMLAGKGVNIKGMGAFTFEVFSDIVKPAQLSGFDVTKDLNDQRQDRKHVHQIRPCFVPDEKLKKQLLRYPGKEEIEAPKSQHSIYQKGFQMIYCNPIPIATSCMLGKEIVQSVHQSFIQAIVDLTTLGYSLDLNFGFIKISINNRNLRYAYNQNFVNSLNFTSFEQKMRKSDQPTSDHWKITQQDKMSQSTLNTLLKRPNEQKVQEHYEKSLALKIMSLDLSTTEKTLYSDQKKQTKK